MAGENGRARKTRSKTGCLTCRQRKVRCDEHRPVCHACRRLSLGCSYLDSSAVTSHSASPKQKHSTGIVGHSSASIPAVAPGCPELSPPQSEHGLGESDRAIQHDSPAPWWASLGEGLLDVNWLEHWGLEHNNFGIFEPISVPYQTESPQSPLRQPTLRRNVTLVPQDREVLQHFTSTMVRFCILRNTLHDNLYSYILTNMGLFHSTLLDAMLAWSALHLAHVRQKSSKDSKERYDRAYTALIEDLAHDAEPSLVLATIWFLMQYQLILAEGVEWFCELLSLAADVARAELQHGDAEVAMNRIGPIGSLILVWMSARDSQLANLGLGGKLLGCLKTYPYIYELVETSSVSEASNDTPHVTFMAKELLSERPMPSEMQACMRLSLRHVTLAGQIKILGRSQIQRATGSAWDTMRVSLRVLRSEIEQDDSPAAKAALGVAVGDMAAMPVVDPICYNRLLLVSAYYTTIIQYNNFQPRAVDGIELPRSEECAKRIIRICQRVSAGRPNSPQGIWPTQIIMAGITTQDPIYQSWAINALKAAERWGPNIVKTRRLLEIVVERQNSGRERADLIEVMKETTGVFII